MHDQVEIKPEALKALKQAIGAMKAKHYLDRFLEESSYKIKDIEQAFSIKDYTTLQHLTHTYASSSATFGAIDLQSLCRRIENSCAEGNTYNMQNDIKALKRANKLSCQILKDYY